MTRMVFNRDGGKTDEFGHLQILHKLFSGEVASGLTVQANSPAAMNVLVNTGVAQIPTGTGTGAYKYYSAVDAQETVTITTADPTNPRNDLIVLYVDKGVVASTGVTNNSNNMLKLAAVAGTAAATPADPNSGAIGTAIGASNPYIVLARVRLQAAATSVTDTYIDNIQTLASLSVGSSIADGWQPADAMVYATNDGGKQYTVTMSGDKTAKYSPGMRLKFARSVTAPTQCFDLESSSSQYASKTTPSGLSFTDDFTCEAWIKPESYNTAATIIGRDSAGGFGFRCNAFGQIELFGVNAASNGKLATSYQSVPLGTWVHVAATLDMSGNAATMYINGISVPYSIGNLAAGATALVQSGNLQLGKNGGSANYFDGKIADVRIWSVIRSQTEIRANMNQQLTGSETNLVAYFKGNGNFNDSTANANNLTQSGGAIATSNDNPMQATEYAIITNVAYSAPTTTLTLFTGNNNVPSMVLNSPYYSTARAPYGFPASSANWKVEALTYASENVAIGSFSVWHASNQKITVPIGEWELGWEGNVQGNGTSASSMGFQYGLGTTSPIDNDLIARFVYGATTTFEGSAAKREKDVVLAAPATYTLYGMAEFAGGTVSWTACLTGVGGNIPALRLYAKCAYL